MKNNKKAYILLKEHKTTGLKYLCRHITNNIKTCYTYSGSGVYWKRHLDKHGYDLKTEILAKCDTIEEARTIGIFFSDLYNIVDSKEFANLVSENGQGGAEVVKYRKKHSGWRGFKMLGELNPSKRPDVRVKISKKLKGRKFTEEWKKKLSKAAKGRPSPNKGKPNPYAKTDHMNIQLICPHCNKQGGKGAMIRWHFDNCKYKK